MSKIHIPLMLKESLDEEYNWWEGEKKSRHSYEPFKKFQAMMEVVHRHNHKFSRIGEELLTVIKYLEERKDHE